MYDGARTVEADVGHDVKRPDIVHVMVMAKFVAEFNVDRRKGDMERKLSSDWETILSLPRYLQGDVID